ncbi:MAG: bifunctional UDP-N-acetylglucosamine diphosphorylase/glucosamine-1-phosphate N-acetyltransferase GlmU [Armatimonadetes bacterium]|nr:bifunctional UDP-N-acetylglucosamine diphosphorylase/glucosamine-1-phosphate N-acetyltransferase GlmU [Armatimonadota bacterium]MDE2205589.1 bifunctional UDP-N-acetylglucosamine diphosphorylase/glucosamine-1-phosphate N-acetyltransferase GlmU [Armatimonadota bacterium]
MGDATLSDSTADDRRPLAAVVLAAGKSTRMRSATPKALHNLCGIPMAQHVVRACRAVGAGNIHVVVGHQAELVRAGLGDDVEYVDQPVQLGTGDAVAQCRPALGRWQGDILVMAGDVPLIRGDSLESMLRLHWVSGAAVTLLTAVLPDPTGYGRVVRNEQTDEITGIVEHRDCSPQQLAIREVNPSIYVFRADALWTALERITNNNQQGEYYLTDTLHLLRDMGEKVAGLPVRDHTEVFGVNNRIELSQAAAILRGRILDALMLSGVSITDPATTWVDLDITVGEDTVIEPNTLLSGNTHIGAGCVIGPGARIVSSTIGDGSVICSSQVVDSRIGAGCKVGPFAHLRPGTVLGQGVKIGDFVEIKNSRLETGAQASHLAYIGDAEIGRSTNIGAGTITCNYDGAHKHRTRIGSNVFVGSNSTLIAPLEIGDGAFIAAGSAVPEDVPADALVIARARPVTKPGWAAARRAQAMATASPQKPQP